MLASNLTVKTSFFSRSHGDVEDIILNPTCGCNKSAEGTTIKINFLT